MVEAASGYIRASNADMVLFTCDASLRDLYAGAGWTPMDQVVLLAGPRTNAQPSTELTMMGFLSAKGRAGRPAFEGQPIYFDDDLW